jgi:hypothetical protein
MDENSIVKYINETFPQTETTTAYGYTFFLSLRA